MNFLEAVEKMKEGKKVRRANSNKTHYLDGSGRIYYKVHIDEYTFINYSDVEATDWEIYEEEKKTLSGKIVVEQQNSKFANGTELCFTKDVKQALKEFIDWLKSGYPFERRMRDKEKEIFGERLLE